VAIAFPRRLLPLRSDGVSGLTAVGLTGDEGPGALFSSTARQLARGHLPGHADPRDQHVEVGLVGEVGGVDNRPVRGIGGGRHSARFSGVISSHRFRVVGVRQPGRHIGWSCRPTPTAGASTTTGMP
jgi:hypothetical protein